jgi:uncharacterized protein (TIGR00730 family)
MGDISAICVYCGASDGADPAHLAAAKALGHELAKADIRLIYGGGSLGLMGAVANGVLEKGGKVTGIIPQFLADREVMHKGVTDLIITEDMHERKRLMFEQAEAFVALPGGIGTLEELIEMMTWSQLGQHEKPILLANIGGFWEHLSALLRHMQQSGFIPDSRGVKYLEARAVDDIVPAIMAAGRLVSDEKLERDTSSGDLAKM